MGIKIIGYTDGYRKDVINCLKRNYKRFSSISDTELYEWLKPILTYSWENDLSINKFPYKHGAVVLADNQIVGFLGCIYSTKTIAGKEYIWLNFTTWAIDKKYRFYDFQFTKELCRTADIITDFTASEIERKKNINIFNFKNVESKICLFYTIIPTVISNSSVLFISNERDKDKILDLRIKRFFSDHIKYNIKLLIYSKNNKSIAVFYNIKNDTLIRGHFPCKVCHIVGVFAYNNEDISDTKLFSDSIKTIVKSVQKKEKVMVVYAEKHFFSNYKIKKLLHREKNIGYSRLILNTIPNLELHSYDYLYSEMTILKK